MRKIYLSIVGLIVCAFIVSAQSYLNPSTGFKAKDILPDYELFSAFDVFGDLVYANDGDTIYCFNMETGQEVNKYEVPAGYTAWPSFVTISPDGNTLWAGFTNSGNTDDRIYSIDVHTGIWELEAQLSGNFDLEFMNGKILVSGLNSSDWEDPTCIFILDTTGANNHQKVIDIGGSSAGLATDTCGNVYYGTYFVLTSGDPVIYRWDSAEVAAAITSGGSDTLTIEDGTKLTDLPYGAYDCEVDAGGNLIFNFNSFSSDKILAIWNGNEGDGYNYDTLASTSDGMDWFTMIKSEGNVLDPTDGNGVYVLSWARPIAKVYRGKPPVMTKPLGIISAFEDQEDLVVSLNDHFTDPDDDVSLTYEILSNSFDTVAGVSLNDTLLTIDFLAAGQTNIFIKAVSYGQSVTEKLVVGVQPEITGYFEVSDFEDLTLSEESYWDGSDASGNFVSGLARFANNNFGGFWDGWAYSNTSDVTTPGSVNQYSATTGAGFDTSGSEGKNYGVAYVPTDWVTYEAKTVQLSFTDSSSHYIKGLYVTNSTYATLSMEQGDAFAKKFGGENGNDPDYFKLLIWGLENGTETDTVEFYLADFRFADNTKDYIVKTWQWVELSSLGKADTLLFSVASSDVGTWGINTPMYFNTDNFYVALDTVPLIINPVTDITGKDNSDDAVIDISNVFADYLGGQVTTSIVSNSNPEFAATTISNDELTIDFISEGTTTLIIEGSSNDKQAYDTVLITVTADLPPVVANPAEDVTVSENSANEIISLAQVFTDPDDDDDAITKSVVANSNNTLVSTDISDNNLTLTFAADVTGESEIVIEGLSNGKSVTDTLLVTVNPVIGIEELLTDDITLYPNPSNGKFRISATGENALEIRIYNLSGSLVFTDKQYTDSGEIDISNLPAGKYIVELKTGVLFMIKSIVIE